jgi:transcription elongation GreA/GreB family factor
MSRAFVKEADGDAFAEDLPERPVSSAPNFVTARGLRLIDVELDRLRKALAAAQAAGERAELARHSRDLRYWTARRGTAQLVPPPEDAGRVGFGCAFTVERDDGKQSTYRIVGEDEADAALGRISRLSPMAMAVSGRAVGDLVDAPNGEVEIVAIDAVPEE